DARFGPIDVRRALLRSTLSGGRADARLTATWERASADLQGWVRPLDGTPSYAFELRTDRLPDRIPGVSAWPTLAERAPAACAAQGSRARWRPRRPMRKATSVKSISTAPSTCRARSTGRCGASRSTDWTWRD